MAPRVHGAGVGGCGCRPPRRRRGRCDGPAPTSASGARPTSSTARRTASAMASPSSSAARSPSVGISDEGYGPSVLVGVDTGGTFTDLVADDGTVVKVPSTPDDPPRRSPTPSGRRAASDAARPRHDRRHQRAARAAGRGRRPRHERGLRGRARDRPPGPAVALRPLRRPAGAARAARRCASASPGRLAADGSRARRRSTSTRSTPSPRRRSRPSPCACCTPTCDDAPRARRSAEVLERPRLRRDAARRRCRRSSASTSGR